MDAQTTGTGLAAITEIVEHSDAIIDALRERAFDPHLNKQTDRRYKATVAAEMVGRTAHSIRRVEKEGLVPPPPTDAKGRRVGYMLSEVNRLRDHFGTRLRRDENEDPIRLAIQNFKGGVGKSTVTCHLSQYLAQKGLRVLVIDCDSQASTTTTFGLRPDLDLSAEDTLLPYLDGSRDTLDYAIRDTYWDGLQIIPANLTLYTAEYELAAEGRRAGSSWIERLYDGIRTIEKNYDVILMDPPPALGMISLNVVRAANALIVPTPPAMYDFHSTVTFFRMMEEVLDTVEGAVKKPIDYRFMRVLISKYNEQKSAQQAVVKLLRSTYGDWVLDAPLRDSAEIDNAGFSWKTVYELDKPLTSADTHKRALASLNLVCREIEVAIRKSWPTHHQRLEEEGVVIN